LDGDGQHDPADIRRLLAKLDEGYEMAVGARQVGNHASLGRRFANQFYNCLASWMTGYRIEDLTPVPRGAGVALPPAPLLAAERFLLPYYDHHGFLPLGVSRRLCPDPCRAA